MTKKMTLSRAKRILKVVNHNKSFWLCTNEYLKSLSSLSSSLESVSDDVFRYHVDKYKNDFSNWVKDVIDDKDLAREISRIKTRDTLIRKIRENVDEAKTLVRRYQKPVAGAKATKAKPVKKVKVKTGFTKLSKKRPKVVRKIIHHIKIKDPYGFVKERVKTMDTNARSRKKTAQKGRKPISKAKHIKKR